MLKGFLSSEVGRAQNQVCLFVLKAVIALQLLVFSSEHLQKLQHLQESLPATFCHTLIFKFFPFICTLNVLSRAPAHFPADCTVFWSGTLLPCIMGDAHCGSLAGGCNDSEIVWGALLHANSNYCSVMIIAPLWKRPQVQSKWIPTLRKQRVVLIGRKKKKKTQQIWVGRSWVGVFSFWDS